MELLIAILCYFNMMTYQQAQMSPMQVNQLLMQNQPTVQYYQTNPNELQLVAERVNIDRKED